MAYPYAGREVAADAVVHVVGLVAAFWAAWWLVTQVTTETSDVIAGVAVYAGFMIFALSASAAYHLLPWEGPRGWLHRIDHAAIYLKIAGTYTPLVLILGHAFGYAVLVAVWTVSVGGAVAKLSVWHPGARGSLPLYLALGWAAILLIPIMWGALPGAALALIAGGGLLYTIGTIFFCAAMPFQNAIWHGFVLCASACFFAAIALSVPATA